MEGMKDALAKALGHETKEMDDVIAHEKKVANAIQREENRMYFPQPRETRLVGKVTRRVLGVKRAA